MTVPSWVTFVELTEDTTFVGLAEATTFVGLAEATTFVGFSEATTFVGLAETTTFVGLAETMTFVGLAEATTFVGLSEATTLVGLSEDATFVGAALFVCASAVLAQDSATDEITAKYTLRFSYFFSTNLFISLNPLNFQTDRRIFLGFAPCELPHGRDKDLVSR
ncbi:MAG: hypothetical protein ACLP2Y_08485 [Limisphaerales bacterium]